MIMNNKLIILLNIALKVKPLISMQHSQSSPHSPKKSRRQQKSQPSRTHNFTSFKQVSRTQYTRTHNSQYQAKPTQSNFIYKHLKNQQIINVIMSRIFKKPSKIKTQVDMDTSRLFRSRPKTQMSQKRMTTQYSANNSNSNSKCNSSKKLVENQETIKKVQSFNNTLKVFHKSMIVNKNRIGLLSKYNNYVKEFQQKLPKDPAQQTRQSIQQNEKLIQICIEDSKAKDKKAQFKQRYQQILQYQQPTLEPKIKEQFLKKRANNRIRQNLKQARNKQN